MKGFFKILVLLFAVSISSAFAQKNYKIGDYYNDGTKEGVVFWVDEIGAAGKIVSLGQSKLPFCTGLLLDDDGYWITISTNQTNGKVNTDKVMDSDDRSEYPAFTWCRNMGKDWYLPAINELKLLLLNDNVRDAVNKTLNSRRKVTLPNRGESVMYWSSTEDIYEIASGLCAYYVYMLNGRVDSQIVGNEYFVRAIAQFDSSAISNSSTYVTKTTSSSTTVSAATTSKTYKVGDYYNDGAKEGVVFWVDATGKHGKIVSLDRAYLNWCTQEQYHKKVYPGGLNKTDGKENTDRVMAHTDCNEYPAFVWCRNKGKDWYLPAIEELEVLILNTDVYYAVNKRLEDIGATKLYNKEKQENDNYCSSTGVKDVKFCSWPYYRDKPSSGFSSGLYKYYVRAVAQF